MRTCRNLFSKGDSHRVPPRGDPGYMFWEFHGGGGGGPLPTCPGPCAARGTAITVPGFQVPALALPLIGRVKFPPWASVSTCVNQARGICLPGPHKIRRMPSICP